MMLDFSKVYKFILLFFHTTTLHLIQIKLLEVKMDYQLRHRVSLEVRWINNIWNELKIGTGRIAILLVHNAGHMQVILRQLLRLSDFPS